MVTLSLKVFVGHFFRIVIKKNCLGVEIEFHEKKKSLGQKIQMEPTKLVLNLVKGLLITRH